MLVKPSFDEVADEVQPGRYTCIVKDAKLGEWSTGTPYVNWRLETYGEKDAKNNGRAIWHRTAAAGKGAFQLQRFYKAATGQALTGEFDTEQLVGKKVQVEVAERVYEGKTYAEVKAVSAVV